MRRRHVDSYFVFCTKKEAIPFICPFSFFLLQSPSQRHNNDKDERLSNNNIKISPMPTPCQPTPPASPQQATASRRLLQDILSKGGPYPMIAIPDKGYWVDGSDHDSQFDQRTTTQGSCRPKFETDDTAKCYRRFFVGRVSLFHNT